MARIAPSPAPVSGLVGGIDTHKDVHVAAVVDAAEQVLGTASFPTTRTGYRRLTQWLQGFGEVRLVGVEGTGSYGAGIYRHLSGLGIEVLEVDRPDRADRRRRGKSDTYDAVNAALAARRGQRTTTPKRRDGLVEALRVLRVTRTTAVKSRRCALQLLHNEVVAAPADLRDAVRGLARRTLVRTCAACRPDAADARDPAVATRLALRSLARRILELDTEIGRLDALIAPLVAELASALLERPGIGPEIAGQLLVTAGDNPERLRSESAFAMLCGASPLPASSGKTERHRLNRGGDRQANSALYMVVVCRMRVHEPTKAYVARRTAEGLSKPEIMRCLKRYVAREVFALLRVSHPNAATAQLAA